MTKKKNAKNQELLGGLYLDQYSSKSRFAESFRTLRTNIQFSFVGKGFKTLLLTSAGAGEGKTTNTANLAYTMAAAGKKVLMIDADLRKPSLSQLAGKEKPPGLTELLTQAFDYDTEHGSLAEAAVGDLIRLISFHSNTGVLHLNEADQAVDIYFLKGKLRDVQWLTRPKEMRLAAVIAKLKLLTPDQIAGAIENQKRIGYRLGYILIHMGLLKEEDLTDLIESHMVEGLRVALGFEAGDFRFEHLSDSFFDRPAFDPVDLEKLYRQVVIGEENTPYLQQKIYDSIITLGDENLCLLTSGALPPRPTELLESEQMAFLLKSVARRFDRILIDSPPVAPASDALVIAPQTDGVVFVVQSGKGNRDVARKAMDQLRMAQANIVGAVLNRRDFKRKGYYYYYYYNKYYSKYYGDKE